MSEQYYHQPLIIAYSGGKDSDVLLDLALRADIDIKVVNSHTTADAPQTVWHIRDVFTRLKDRGIDTEIIYPTYKGKRISMWTLIPMKLMPPTRIVRYCCQVLKESATPRSFVATGVRADESAKRSKRKRFEILGSQIKTRISHDLDHIQEVYKEAQEMPEVYDCMYITKVKQNKDAIVNPIINWTEKDIWTYIHTYIHTGVCELYGMGYKRVGCIGCPMAGKARYKEFRDFPKIEKNYKLAFDRMLTEIHKHHKKTKWHNAQEVFDWWMEKDIIFGQMRFDFEKEIIT